MENRAKNPSTVIVESFRNAAKDPLTGSNNYKGLRIHTWPGLHEFLAAHLREHVKAGGTVLDPAAGSRAMSLRMSDIGYQVTATDYVTENFRLHAIYRYKSQ